MSNSNLPPKEEHDPTKGGHAFYVVAWANAPEEERQKVTRHLATMVNRLGMQGAERSEQPSEEYEAFHAAYMLLWYLKRQENVETLPEKFREEEKLYIKR